MSKYLKYIGVILIPKKCAADFSPLVFVVVFFQKKKMYLWHENAVQLQEAGIHQITKVVCGVDVSPSQLS